MGDPSGERSRWSVTASFASFGLFLLALLGVTSCTGEREVQVELEQMRTDEHWAVPTRNATIWIFRRTRDEVAALTQMHPPGTELDGPHRSLRPDIFVVFGNCPGSDAMLRALRKMPGFVCEQTGVTYDFSGRPLVPNENSAPLAIPDHHYESADVLVVSTR